jgi:hypothetical protein
MATPKNDHGSLRESFLGFDWCWGKDRKKIFRARTPAHRGAPVGSGAPTEPHFPHKLPEAVLSPHCEEGEQHSLFWHQSLDERI